MRINTTYPAQYRAKETFGLEQLAVSPMAFELPVNLLWHQSRDSDPAHAFLREQLANAFRQFAEGPVTRLSGQ